MLLCVLCSLVLQAQKDSGWSLTGSAPQRGATTLSQSWTASTGLSPCGQVGSQLSLLCRMEPLALLNRTLLLLRSHVRLKEGTISDPAAKYSRFYLPLPSTFSKIIIQVMFAPNH